MGALILAGLALATALLPGPRDPLLTLVPAAVGILVLICFHALRTITGGARQHGQIGTAVRATAVTVTDTERLLRRPSWRLAGAMAYLGADMAVLWISFEATGVAPPVAVLVLAYLIGYLANVLPVPGGIGILDSGIVGALVLYHARPPAPPPPPPPPSCSTTRSRSGSPPSAARSRSPPHGPLVAARPPGEAPACSRCCHTGP
jgi:uncharacterized membrane protein YbhN (UPF0104 family)